MLCRNCFKQIITKYTHRIENISSIRFCSAKKNEKTEDVTDNKLHQTLNKISSKYKIFQDSDSVKILDVYEEQLKYSNLLEKEPQEVDPFEGLNLLRGINGVFEIEDLIELLKRDHAEDIFVAELPKNVKYVDYMCVVTAKSYRHMQAIAQFVRRVYKQKRCESDFIPRLEGEDSKEWMALDLGNIALHIFSKEGRRKYDLDTLWAVGTEYDEESHREDPVVEMLEKHSIYLKDLKPAR